MNASMQKIRSFRWSMKLTIMKSINLFWKKGWQGRKLSLLMKRMKNYHQVISKRFKILKRRCRGSKTRKQGRMSITDLLWEKVRIQLTTRKTTKRKTRPSELKMMSIWFLKELLDKRIIVKVILTKLKRSTTLNFFLTLVTPKLRSKRDKKST